MQPGVVSVVVMLALVFGSGWIVYHALVPRGRSIEALALAPALSAALVFVLGGLAQGLGFSFGPGSFLGALAVISAVAGYRWFRRPRQPRGDRPDDVCGETRFRGTSLVLLGLACLLAAGSWFAGMSGVATTPPSRDAANHGLMAARVAQLESLDVEKVLHADVEGERPQTAFYPLALHGQVAIAHRLAGVTIADGLLAATVAFAVLTLPLNLFLLTRRLMPGRHLAAGLAALLVPGIGFFPLFPIGWGSMTIIAGIAMAPAASVVTERFLLAGDRSSGVLGAAAVLGIFGTHSSELALVAVLVACLLLESAIPLGLRTLPRIAARALFLGSGLLVALAPVLDSLSAGAAERTTIGDRQIESLSAALSRFWEVVSFPSSGRIPVLLLGGLGALYCLARRRHVALLGICGSLLALFFVAAMLDGTLQAMTLPWYQQSKRIAFNLVIVIPLLGGLLLARGHDRLAARARTSRLSSRTPLLIIIGIAGWIGVTGAISNAQGLHRIFTMHAMADADALEAFSFLASVTNPGDRVLIDRTKGSEDGGAWMYAFAGVQPLLTLEPALASPSWSEREWLVGHLPEVASNPVVPRLLDKYGVRYVYVNEENWEGAWAEPELDLEVLRRTPGFCERFRQGTSQVFGIGLSGTCA